MLSGRNMITVPKERTMSGQNRSSSPVCGRQLRRAAAARAASDERAADQQRRAGRTCRAAWPRSAWRTPRRARRAGAACRSAATCSAGSICAKIGHREQRAVERHADDDREDAARPERAVAQHAQVDDRVLASASCAPDERAPGRRPRRSASATMNGESNQSSELPSSSTVCSEPRPTASRAIASQSMPPCSRRCGVVVGQEARGTSAPRAMPTGTLTKKIQRQSTLVTM